jgi:hypothetical protein
LHPTSGVSSTIWRAHRVRHLETLHEKWTAELEQLPSPSEHAHLAEALDDLQTLIRRLKLESQADDRVPGPVLARSGEAPDTPAHLGDAAACGGTRFDSSS